MGINTTLPLWVIVDIYGNSTAVEFIGEFAVTVVIVEIKLSSDLQFTNLQLVQV